MSRYFRTTADQGNWFWLLDKHERSVRFPVKAYGRNLQFAWKYLCISGEFLMLLLWFSVTLTWHNSLCFDRYFNSLQSDCFYTCFYSDVNMVISAPTGSGKTVLFELCILRLFSKFITAEGNFIHHKGTLKTVCHPCLVDHHIKLMCSLHIDPDTFPCPIDHHIKLMCSFHISTGKVSCTWKPKV